MQINGQTLILAGAGGDITVVLSNTTRMTKTSTATLGDITPGECIVAMGTKDPSGLVTATSVRLAPRGPNGCATGRSIFSPAPGASARPSPSPRPAPSAQADVSLVSGEVTTVSGTSVTVLTPTNASETLTVPTVANMSLSSAATAASLQVGQCLRAAGSPDASGAIQATALTITPPRANGTCSTGSGAFGRQPGDGAPAAGS
ncbi:hypothetical protein EPN29_04585 [bacterium]|nr:MAG: hypothetical protein EPN29_04585 [bacterium]